ncbi:MAG: hypothetical protein ACRCZF_11785, partial [Gemmataceae bacterium]
HFDEYQVILLTTRIQPFCGKHRNSVHRSISTGTLATYTNHGTILATNGYHATSGLYLAMPPGLKIDVPDHPTTADVRAAVATLDDVLCDFLFVSPEHRGSWYASLLTLLARFAFTGSSPLFLVDANSPGTGKGLLIDLAGVIATGDRLPGSPYVHDMEEMRKCITSLAMSGRAVVHFDNVSGPFGNSALDLALTEDVWDARKLGPNEHFTPSDDVSKGFEDVRLSLGGPRITLPPMAFYCMIDFLAQRATKPSYAGH